MIPKVLNKTLKKKVPKLILITPSWITQVWYPKILNMSIKNPILLTWRRDLLKKSKRGNSSPSSEQDSITGGVDGFCTRLLEKRISKAASDLISRSRRPNFNANYKPT